jgi:predicted phosphodiesterase
VSEGDKGGDEMTRLAVLSDIHGNLLALEAVLADIEAQGIPDTCWMLGDLAAFCPWPSATIARLRALPHAAFLRGNTDRYLATGRRPMMLPACSAEEWAGVPARLAERDANFRWTVEQLSFTDYEFLRDLRNRLTMDIPGYGRMIAAHATPANDETNLYPDTPDDEIRPYLVGLDARLMLYGHTHCPVDRMVNGIRIVNSGSVGLPLDGDPRAAYALLDFEHRECTVTIRRVSYDREAVIAELERVNHPAKAWVAGILREARS